jgi:hypothetical protein
MGKKKEQAGTWFEVVAHSDALAKNVIEIPDGQRYTIRGPIHEVMIVSIPPADMNEMMKAGTFQPTMDALGTAVRGGGFEGGLLIVPEGLGFMKLQPVDKITAKLLEQRDQRQRAEYEAKLKKIKEDEDESLEDRMDDTKPEIPDNVTELKPDTKTMGEA